MKKNEKLVFPTHIAIIMDGNGRWAKKRMLNVSAGHYAGARTLRRLCEDADKAGLKYLTVYAFSTENRRRAPEEVAKLMDLIRQFVQEYINDTDKKNLKMRVIGDISYFPEDIQKLITFMEQETKDKTGLTVCLALNYGSKDEITRAVKKAAKAVDITADTFNEDTLSQYLDTAFCPNPDIIIRTAGERRLSNFLLWQAAYAELYFDDTLWPDYNIEKLNEAVRDYNKRERRFGGR